MGSLLVQVAIYGVAAAAAAPIALVVSALILGKSSRPLPSAWMFVAGAAFLDILIAVVVLASGIFDDGGDAGAYFDVFLGVVFSATGVIAIFSKDSPEKDAAQRARADKIATAKLPMLFVAGIAVQVINFDAIAVFGGAVKEVAAADVSTGEAVIALAFGLAIMLSVYYVPALIYMLVPKKASSLLAAMTEWIMSNSRMLEIVVGLGFGVLFLYKGLVVLL